jgi:hypothetical protein
MTVTDICFRNGPDSDSCTPEEGVLFDHHLDQEIGKTDGRSRRARLRRFDLTEHQNRLDGSPWRESGKPARHISPKAVVLRAE